MSRWPSRLAFAFALSLLPHATAADDGPPPRQALQLMKLPEGFRVELVAGEPELVKPIAMTTDESGRVWVVESHSYPHWLPEGKTGKDRVLIFEPQGNGKYSRKVFLDNGTNLSGIAVGFGGVYLCSVPKIIHVPVKPGEDRPAGPARVLLDGWSLKTKHNVVNGLDWGPDGWLWGLNGIQSVSKVGAPGTPDARRVPLDCGVWRYHPVTGKFEVVARGTTNPWGMDWDEHGEAFITNCVIKHIFHVVPGARFVRMYGQDLDAHSYGLIESCADHIHWGGGDWTSSRGGKGKHSDAGGGHAHAGAMFYLGDVWPAEYRNRVFMCNIHGNRLNQNRIERSGSGYVAKRAPDFLFANDSWFRGLTVRMAADGNAYVSDWHDTGECHNYDKTHKSGRVYKVSYGETKHAATALDRLSDDELVKLQSSRNEWLVRQSRRLLQERHVAGKLNKGAAEALARRFEEAKDAAGQLRALWALHVVGGLDEKKLLSLFDHAEEAVRVWAVRLLVDESKASDAAVRRMEEHAAKEKSAAVRLALASALQKLPVEKRWGLAAALACRAEDAGDAYLPLMIWYGIEPSVVQRPEMAAELLTQSKIPLVRRNVARRIAALTE